MNHDSATKLKESLPMRRAILAAFVAALWAFPAAAADFGGPETADLARVSDYLNALQSAEGRFFQIGPDGRVDEGMFYLRKPGRMRFEYTGNPIVVVADGTTIAVENSDLRTTDRYPLTDSPLRLLLSDDIDLSDDPRITALRREEGALSVTARQDTGIAQGQITLQFADAGGVLELRQWEVIDAQGLRTQVALTQMRRGVTLSPRLFVIEDLSPFDRRTF